MSDEFGTVSVRRGDRGRELELVRQHYRQHRESLVRLINDAPTEHLAAEYQKLVQEIDTTLAKLDEIEGRSAAAAAEADVAAAAASMDVPPAAIPPRGPTPFSRAQGDPLRPETQPGNRPLIPPPGANYDRGAEGVPSAGSRMTLIAIAGIVVLALIGWLIWRASSERKSAVTTPVAQPVPVTAPVTPAPAPAGLSVTPAVLDFGTVAKGTRAARQFDVTNNTDAPVTIQLTRSQCRCLYYEYNGQIAPKKRESVTVTVDGARAKAGTLDETITISAKKDPSVSGTFQVTGAVK